MAKAKEVPEEKPVEMDMALFQSTAYSNRTKEVPVPGLAERYFPEGVNPIIVVRNLSAIEIAQIDAEVSINREVTREINAGGTQDDITKALRTVFRFIDGADVPDTYVRSIHIVTKGTISPVISHENAMKLGEHHPVEFNMVFRSIMELTGLGSLPEK